MIFAWTGFLMFGLLSIGMLFVSIIDITHGTLDERSPILWISLVGLILITSGFASVLF